MTLHVCLLGIDGSGKSTVTACLPRILAAELDLLVGSAGESLCIVGPDEDHLAPRFHPDGLLLAGRLSKRFKRIAKRVVNNRRLYPIFKIAQMIFQDSAAYKLGRRYQTDVMVSDGNLILSVAGRAGNYRRPASDHADAIIPAPDAGDLKAMFSYVLNGQRIPEERKNKLPPLGKGRMIYRFCRLLGIKAGWLPDVVVFLDLSPKAALARIAARGPAVDRHENEDDLAQAREMYLKTLDAFRRYQPEGATYRIPVDGLTPGEMLRAVVDALRPHLKAQSGKDAGLKVAFGTTTDELCGAGIWAKILNYRYVMLYLVGKFFQGAWREPTFPLSRLGRLFLREGYSASVMRVIYDQDEERPGLLDRIFLAYPLHRAVYDRLQILTGRVKPELEAKLNNDRAISIFTAPSGFAYDLFRPLEDIATRRPDMVRRIRLLAADLDPHGVLADELTSRANKMGIDFEFVRGDITDDAIRARLQEAAPFDMVLFVGLSSWLPKPRLTRHLRWVRENIREDGILVTDSFTPEAYALSGKYVGYKANYYPPDVYKVLMDYCGFDGLHASVESGRDAINHVMLFSPRKLEAEGAALPESNIDTRVEE